MKSAVNVQLAALLDENENTHSSKYYCHEQTLTHCRYY